MSISRRGEDTDALPHRQHALLIAPQITAKIRWAALNPNPLVRTGSGLGLRQRFRWATRPKTASREDWFAAHSAWVAFAAAVCGGRPSCWPYLFRVRNTD